MQDKQRHKSLNFLGKILLLAVILTENQTSALRCPAGKHCSSSGGTTDNGNCDSGTYNTGNGWGLCISCPPGQTCSSTTSGPNGTCNVNSEYSHMASSSCDSCPAGYSCGGTGSSPMRCAPGTWSADGQSVCSICSAGKECKDGSESSISGDYYSEGSAAAKKAIAAGYRKTSSSAPPKRCAYGESWSGGVCSQCTAGNYCPDPTGAPVSCPNGTDCHSNGMYYVDYCPAGYSCTAGIRTACGAGTFALGSAVACTDCPSGYMCPATDSPPKICPRGTFSEAAAVTCTFCPTAGKECKSLGTTDASSIETDCGTGYYRVHTRGAISSHRCLKCSLGHYCPNKTDAPIPCATGWYADDYGKTVCTICPINHACPYADAAPHPCPKWMNTQNNQGWTGCQLSTSLYASTTGTKEFSSIACSNVQGSATYAWPVSGICKICPAGFMCPIIDALPKICLRGFHSADGAVDCTQCAAGFKCPTPLTALKTPCSLAHATGYWSQKGAVNCYPVPAGMQGVVTSNARPTWCNQQTKHSKTGDMLCVDCPVGQECISDNHPPIDCPIDKNAFFSRVTEKTCHPSLMTTADGDADIAYTSYQIPVGKLGWRGAFKDADTNSDGTSGRTSILGDHITDCPQGMQCIWPDEQIWNDCPPGTYSLATHTAGKQAVCEPCPENMECVKPTNIGTSFSKVEAQALRDGYWSPQGTHMSFVSPAGWESPQAGAGTKLFRPCKLGWTADNKSGACTECLAGKHCPHASNEMILCPEGLVAAANGLHQCVMCAQNEAIIGRTTTTSGACGPVTPGMQAIAPMYTLETCLYGTYSDGASVGDNDKTDCRPCAAGHLCDQAPAVAAATTECPAGFTCNAQDIPMGAYKKIPCPAGFYKTNASNGQSDPQVACTICPAGNYCVGGATSTGAETCPMGYFCPIGTRHATQYPCAPGTFRATTGASAETDCVACTSGKWCMYGTSTPFDCPPGYTCSQTSPGNVAPFIVACAAGQFCPPGGGGACPDHHYCPPGSTYAQKCPTGTIRTGSPSAYAWDCTDVAIGKVNSGWGEDDSVPPQKGYMYPGRVSYAQEFPCPPGTFGATTTIERFGDCTPCPAGYACPQGTASLATPGVGAVPIKCEPGYICETGTMHPRQTPCTGGKYNPSRGKGLQTDCLDCPAGSYCPVGSYRPFVCPEGYFCEANTENYELTPCLAGKYGGGMDDGGTHQGGVVGLVNAAACSSCPKGMYCEYNYQKEPKLCPIGTFSDVVGAMEAGPENVATACKQCTAGYHCPHEGVWEIANYICPTGTYSPAGSQVCFACQAGRDCGTAGTTQTVYESAAGNCLGKVCEAAVDVNGNYQLPRHTTSDCPIGYYCPSGSFFAVPCPVGTYGPAINKQALTDCLPTPNGKYTDKPGTPITIMTNQLCEPGYMCPTGVTIGSFSKFQIQCAPGTFTDTEGQHTCAPCTVGYYCPGATTTKLAADTGPLASFRPLICPAGYYCLAGATSPTMCDVGKFGSRTGAQTPNDCTPCLAGSYCAEPGATAPTGKCDAGFICLAGSSVPRPNPNDVGNTNYDATVPASGTYSPVNMGSLCPPGGYCEIGSSAALSCQGGYFNPNKGGKNILNCQQCYPGHYCAGENSSTPTGRCKAGYVCNAGSSVDDQYPVQPGYFSRNDASLAANAAYVPTDQVYMDKIPYKETACVIGQFNTKWHSPFCLPCEPGFYCDNSATGVERPTANLPKMCRAGRYCPTPAFPGGTWEDHKGSDKEITCGVGTYNPTPYAQVLTNCLKCPAGYYCGTEGLSEPTGFTAGYNVANAIATNGCHAGYFCRESAIVPNPDSADLVSNTNPYSRWGRCWKGHYCPQGTGYPYPCPLGTYRDQESGTQVSDCSPCASGHYCGLIGIETSTGAIPSKVDTSTPALTLSTAHWANATPCQRGYFCLPGQKVKAPVAGICEPGKQCPAGTTLSGGIPCAAGTYAPNAGMWECLTCPEGYYCFDLAGGTTIEPKICEYGHRCPAGTAVNKGIECAAGTFQPETGRHQCVSCPAGQFCAATGINGDAKKYAPCLAGYFCKEGNTVGNPTFGTGGRCAVGQYCDAGSGFPRECDPGKACPNVALDNTGMVDCTQGYFCVGGTTTATPLNISADKGAICPAGYFCPTASARPQPCQQGKYNAFTGKWDEATHCLPCPATKYCEGHGVKDPLNCADGFFCDGGDDAARPKDKVCPKGYYCVAGLKTACAAGQYQDQIGQSSCKPCPAGYRCDGFVAAGQGADSLVPCGYNAYCPINQSDKVPCANGKYTSNKLAVTLTECKPCPAGYTCNCGAAVAPACTQTFTQCTAGKYCPAESYDEAQSPVRDCTIGHFCPTGTPAELPCEPGTACTTGGLALKDEDCDSKFYCLTGSTTKTPPGATTMGGACPCGHYCPAATHAPVPCPLDTFNPDTDKDLPADCQACGLGKECAERGMCAEKTPTTTCPSGFFCATASPEPCPVGNYCESGVTAAVPCGNYQSSTGYYQPNTHQSVCIRCPAGFKCETPFAEAVPCPEGLYCPKGTADPALNKCGVGSYGPFTGLRYLSECTACKEGYLCATEGMAALTNAEKCPVGKYCPKGSSAAIDCSTGAICPEGSAYPTLCPVGTFNDLPNKGLPADCLDCPQFKACPSRGMTSALQQNCADGFVCGPSGAGKIMSATPTTAQQGGLCPKGKYCSRVVDGGPQDCPIGTYNPNFGAGACIYCPAGRLCETPGLEASTECPVGYYCPGQSAVVVNAKIACPAGTYGAIKNAGLVSECTPCTVGHFCTGIAAVPQQCTAGHFCPIGQSVANPGVIEYIMGDPLNIGGLCPKGYFCPAGAQAPQPCAVGTYGNQIVGATVSTQCEPCPGGYYCDVVGLDYNRLYNIFAKKCWPGYYCTAGAIVPYPTDGTTGNICPPGHYCPGGDTVAIACPTAVYTGISPISGTLSFASLANYSQTEYTRTVTAEFEPRSGSAACQTCPAGYYCKTAGTITPVECTGGFCEAGEGLPAQCAAGFYSDSRAVRMASSEECFFCPNTKYCNGGLIQGTCSAGYFCDFGAKLAEDPSKICPVGHYCIQATKLPTRCPEGDYNGIKGAPDISWCVPCVAGNYCIPNDSVMRICPKGHLCPEKSTEPTPCFKGTYNPEKGKWQGGDCLSCPKGSYCNDRGISDYKRFKCPVGHFCDQEKQKRRPVKCPAGTFRNATGGMDNGVYDNFIGNKVGNSSWVPYDPAGRDEQCWNCTEGTFCPPASTYPQPCEAGYMCPNRTGQPYACPPKTFCGAMSPKPNNCPAGYFCPGYQTDIYTKCVNGTYCPESSDREIPCPAGYFGSGVTTNWNQTAGCIGCGRGEYSSPRTKSCEPCSEGYVCLGFAVTAKPTTIAQGGKICPKGFYCPKGSYTEIACPVGTFSDKEGIGNLNECQGCPKGSFNSYVGATSCRQCKGSTISQPASVTCKCIGLNRKYLADEGACVCKTGFNPTDGTKADKDGFADCERQIYENCTPEQTRDSNGVCRNPDDCSDECDGGQGAISENFGMCQCANFNTVDSICNKDCRKKLPRTTFTSGGEVRIFDPVTNSTVITKLDNVAGTAKCALEDNTQCAIVPIKMAVEYEPEIETRGPNKGKPKVDKKGNPVFKKDKDGEPVIKEGGAANGNFQANFDLPDSIPEKKSFVRRQFKSMSYTGQRFYSWQLDPNRAFRKDGDVLTGEENDKAKTKEQKRKDGDWPWAISENQGAGRNLQASTAPATTDPNAKFITNPVICINRGSALLFEGLGPKNYPVYVKDSLLNQNEENFDYGEFEKLSGLLKDGKIKSFIFTFADPGFFVFSDSRNKAKQMCIAVMSDDKKCPGDSTFSPQTYASLLKMNAFRRDVLTPPDWPFLILVMVSFMGLILLTFIVISCVMKNDWHQTSILAPIYQKANYTKVENSNPEDKKAIVSINTESSSFQFNSGAADAEVLQDEEEALFADVAKGKKKKKNKKRNKDNVELQDVVDAKDNLVNHLRDIKKLLHRGEKEGDNNSEDQLSNGEESSDAEDDRNLNRRIADLKKLIGSQSKRLKGDHSDESEDDGYGIGMDESVHGDNDDTEKNEIEAAEQRRQAREEEDARLKEEMRDALAEEEAKFINSMQAQQEEGEDDLDQKRNRVLEMQVESAFDKGKDISDRMKRLGGASDHDVKGMMDELENKMQRVEDVLLSDQDRQKEQLQQRMAMRARRRRKYQAKMEEQHDAVQELEHTRHDQKEDKLIEIQTELKEDLEAMDEEFEEAKESMDRNYVLQKQDKMSEYQDKLKGADGEEATKDILAAYQRAQGGVDKELDKQKNKELDKMQQELMARKQRRRAQAELKRKEEFKEIDSEINKQADHHNAQKAQIAQQLMGGGEKGLGAMFAKKLNSKMEQDYLIHEEMERKRREEEALEAQQARDTNEANLQQQNTMKRADDEVESEINKLANLSSFEPFQENIQERDRINRAIQGTMDENEKAKLMAQLADIDKNVKDNLTADAKQQDAKLAARLEARRKKKLGQLDQNTALKKAQLEERIQKALTDSKGYQAKRNERTMEEIEKTIREMQLQMPPEEIPAAVERMIDDRHAKELEDMLLKLYEQKAIQLKEEILTLLEEKSGRQLLLKQQAEDRKRGLDAIIGRSTDQKVVKEMISKKGDIDGQLATDLDALEEEYRKKEGLVTREVQGKTMDRETDQIGVIQEQQNAEKRAIFERFLPDAMMSDILDAAEQEDRIEMNKYKDKLQKEKAAYIKEMQHEEAELEKLFAADKAQHGKLSKLDQQAQARTQAERKYKTTMKRRDEFKEDSAETIKKMRDEFQKGLENLDAGFEKERQSQFDELEVQLKARRERVAANKQEQKELALKKEREAQEALERKYGEVRKMRTKRDTIEKAIQDGQKLIFRGCYSRTLYPYNPMLAGPIEDHGDYDFDAKDKAKFERVIYDELLAKIDHIQKSLYSDIDVLQEAARNQAFKPGGQAGLEDDMISEISGSRYGGMSRMGTGMSNQGRGSGMSRQGSVASAGGLQGKLGRRMSGLMGLKAKLGQKKEF